MTSAKNGRRRSNWLGPRQKLTIWLTVAERERLEDLVAVVLRCPHSDPGQE
jgi:hypothetical protein